MHKCRIEKRSIQARWHEEYPVVCDNKVYDSAVGCDFWAGVRLHSGSDTLCKSNDDTLSIMYRSPFGRNTYEWYEVNDPSNILSTEPFLNIKKAGFYIVSCTRHLSDGSTCSQSFGKTIYPAEVANMVYTPSNIICQNGRTTLSISNLKPINYLWDVLPLNSVINQGGKTALAIDTGICSVQIEYPNGCKDTILGNVKRDGLHITQSLTESRTPFETYVVNVCNLNSLSANNVVVNFTSSSNFEPVLPLPPGWSQSGTQFSHTIPVIPGLPVSGIPNCEMIMLPIKANKCPTSHTVSATTSSPAFTCGSASKTDIFWIQNDFTPILTSSKDAECFGQPITMTASPAGGSYLWKENGITHGYFQNLSQQLINFTSGITTSIIAVDITKNQCKKSIMKTIKMASNPWAGVAVITNKSCNPSNVLGSIKVPITLPGLHTYVWSNGARTQNIAGLDPIGTQTYALTVTNSIGCTYTNSYSVGNLSTIQASIKIGTNCATTPVLTAIPSGGLAPYTFEWRSWNGVLASTTNTVNLLPAGSTLKVTDANRCTRTVAVPTTVPTTTITPTTIPTNTIFNNQKIIITGDVPVTSTWRFTDCEVILNQHSDGLTLASPAGGRAEVYLTNSLLHTCNGTMARGIRMTRHNDVCYPKNTIIEDMFAGVEILPAAGQSNGTFYLPVENTTFKNNFIGIRIQAPIAKIVQQNIPGLNSSPPTVQFIPNYFAGNTFEGSPTIKTYNLAGYPSTSLMTNLEKAYVPTNWGSYAALVSNCQNNFDIGVPSNPISGFFPAVNTVKNLANGILLENTKANVLNTQFLNLNPASTITNTNSSFFHRGIAIFARGTAATTQKLTVRGLNTSSPDVSNVQNGIIAQDINIDVQNMKINNTIGDRGVSFQRTSNLTLKTNTLIMNNQIKAPKPILGIQDIGDLVQIQLNAIEDALPANITGALVDIQGHTNTGTSGVQPQSNINNNNLTINHSLYGIRKAILLGANTTLYSTINNNHIKIQNTNATNFTRAGIYTDNVRNLDVLSNTIFQTSNAAPGSVSSFNLPASSTPIGIWTNNMYNTNIKCNRLFTQSGSFHNENHQNFLLATNNYIYKLNGAMFRSFGQNSIIPGMSNKFYCNSNPANFMKNLTSGTGLPVLHGFGGFTTTAFPSGCVAPIPYCTSTGIGSPAFLPPFRFYPANLPAGFQAATGTFLRDSSCRLDCPEPKMASISKSPIHVNLQTICDLYPNPNVGSFTIALTNHEVMEDQMQIDVINSLGQIVYQKENLDLIDSKVLIETSLPASIYFIQIRTKSGKKFVKRLEIRNGSN